MATHKNHHLIAVNELPQNFQESIFEIITFLGELTTSVYSANQKFNQIIDEVISELQKIKKKNEEDFFQKSKF